MIKNKNKNKSSQIFTLAQVIVTTLPKLYSKVGVNGVKIANKGMLLKEHCAG